MLTRTNINCIHFVLIQMDRKQLIIYLLRNTFTSISLNGFSSFPVCVCICVAPSAFSPDDSDVFCIIRSAQLHYLHKFNTLCAVVIRDLLVTMDTAEAKCPVLEEEVKGLQIILRLSAIVLRCVAKRGNRKILTNKHKQQPIFQSQSPAFTC